MTLESRIGTMNMTAATAIATIAITTNTRDTIYTCNQTTIRLVINLMCISIASNVLSNEYGLCVKTYDSCHSCDR